MEIHQIEHLTKLKRDKSNQAIALATQGKWDEAAAVNQELLDVIPDDVEALNRLGKALSETGRYGDACKALKRALEISPSNAIARKNLDRMSGLKDAPTPKKSGGTAGRLAPQVFIEESGKSTTTSLLGLGDATVLGQVTSGDTVELVVDGATVEVQNHDGQRLGRLEPKLAARLIKLLDGGNKYVAAVASISAKGVGVVVRETYQSSKMSGLVSFPAPRGRAQAYNADMDVDLDEGADFDTSAGWTPPTDDSDAAEEPSEEQAPVKVKQQRRTRPCR
jgi:tetratricopeptide (TPR) repeat protein